MFTNHQTLQENLGNDYYSCKKKKLCMSPGIGLMKRRLPTEKEAVPVADIWNCSEIWHQARRYQDTRDKI